MRAPVFWTSAAVSCMSRKHVSEPGLSFPKISNLRTGLARLTSALSRRYDHVICVDQSHVHLEMAKAEYNKMRGGDCDPARSLADVPEAHSATFLLTGPNVLGRLGDTKVDLIVTLIALQHTVPPLQALYVEQFCDALKPNGVACKLSLSLACDSSSGLSDIISLRTDVHIPTFLPKYNVQTKSAAGATTPQCDFDRFHVSRPTPFIDGYRCLTLAAEPCSSSCS